MIFPTSFSACLAILVASLLAWGSWASTLKAARKWRYELYYFDFSLGFLIFAAIAAFTLGSLRSNELTFQDNFLITGYRNMAFALAAGVVFNVSNLLLTAAIATGGMALSFPVSLGVALIVGVIWNFVSNPQGNAILLFGGAVFVLVAVVVMGYAYITYKDAVLEAARKAAAMQIDPRSKQGRRTPKTSGAAGAVVLAIVSGVILGFFPPVMDLATSGDNGVAPYGAMLLMAAGLVVSTVIASPFTINFPMGGIPARIADYFRGGIAQHGFGLLGGALLCSALLGGIVVAGSPAAALVGPAWQIALGHAAPLIALLWGMLVWHEFRGARERIRTWVWATLVLYGVGLTMISIAPLYAAK